MKTHAITIGSIVDQVTITAAFDESFRSLIQAEEGLICHGFHSLNKHQLRMPVITTGNTAVLVTITAACVVKPINCVDGESLKNDIGYLF